MKSCKHCGKTSESADDIFAGVCRDCLGQMTRVREVQKPQGQAVVDASAMPRPPESKPEPEEAPMDLVDQALQRVRGF